ncbi:MAG: hypothetical protein ACP5LI_05245 [Hydrogenobaculum sp.]
MNMWKAIAKQQMAFSHYSGMVVIILSILFAMGILAILVVAFKSK